MIMVKVSKRGGWKPTWVVGWERDVTVCCWIASRDDQDHDHDLDDDYHEDPEYDGENQDHDHHDDNHLINPDGRGKPWQPCEGRDKDSNPCKEESKSEGKASNIILKNDKKNIRSV